MRSRMYLCSAGNGDTYRPDKSMGVSESDIVTYRLWLPPKTRWDPLKKREIRFDWVRRDCNASCRQTSRVPRQRSLDDVLSPCHG